MSSSFLAMKAKFNDKTTLKHYSITIRLHLSESAPLEFSIRWGKTRSNSMHGSPGPECWQADEELVIPVPPLAWDALDEFLQEERLEDDVDDIEITYDEKKRWTIEQID